MICSTLLSMISLVVCSIRPEQLAQLKRSVEGSIGLPHEWLVADNRNTGKGICQVYNELAARARYPYLLFIHEDVTFESFDWGPALVEQFEKDDQLGLLGLAGSTIKSRSYSGWYTADARHDRYQLFHALPDRVERLEQLPAMGAGPFPVVCLDGVFLFCRKSVWSEIPFDASSVNGFHFYDLDFSMRVAEKYKVGVLGGLGLLHHTAAGGDYGRRWVREAIRFHRRWKNRLPIQLPGDEISETQIQRIWLDRLKDQDIGFSLRLRWVIDQRQFFQPGLYYSIVKFFLYYPLRLRYLHRYLRKSIPAT
jgi:hypothetical protein